jgi:hypothetical protein
VPSGTHARLRRTGFAVRRCDTFPGLDDGWIRIAVRPAAQTEPLLAALSRVQDGLLQASPPTALGHGDLAVAQSAGSQ